MDRRIETAPKRDVGDPKPRGESLHRLGPEKIAKRFAS